MIRISAVFVAISFLLTGTSAASRPEAPSLKPRADSPVPAAAPSGETLPAPILRPLTPGVQLPGATGPAVAPTTPAATPGAFPGAINVLTANPGSVAQVTAAFRAADRGAWSELSRLQYDASDETVRDVILWKRASDGVPGMTFDELSYALTTLSTWPQTSKMRRRAEEIIDQSNLSSEAKVKWLEESGPITGAGKVALANALRATGQSARAEEVIRDAWRNNSMDSSLQRTVLARWGQSLSQDDHRARVDFLLWTGQRSNAEALKPQLTADYRKLTDARIALSKRARNVDAAIQAVPANLQSHPGLLYERARWRRAKDLDDSVAPLLTQINGKDVPAAGRGRLWDERAIAIRNDLKARNYTRAYQMAAPHGMSEGADFAEAEWISGWIALRLNGDAARGVKHFETMTNGVSSPVSLSRGQYWTGRARDALGQPEQATLAYGAAAGHKYTYYGQLSAERLGDRKIHLGPSIVPAPEEIEAFENDPMVKALRLIGETREMGTYRTFSHHLDDILSTPAEFELLARVNHQFDQPDTAVRAGKAGLFKGVVAPDAAYPVLMHPLSRQPQVEQAFILAITRQESEFNPKARSSVGALGLMQFMPSTARNEARLRGMPYQQSWLTDDPGYNMTLGGLHLDTLLKQFNGSYIMTAAAYNAGPSRPSQWARDYGDPRTGQIDPVDWVEFIPFSETRNYVQRVLENIQVYRHRITGDEADIQIAEDLKRGRR
ncbi:transglycosylase SLT domain-containing protein [Hyphomonas sp. WL0036]|uniref:lytic transglycosylase domain-containing protein n=1 Tax=Hyphomonas sediminis TaxID=2866160 RepID=UPI001C805EC1|nr:transglycosylase SLT domain-containing protein [Hyphomonas sediminis]MBY9066765.1 transglycosylase SLT domain-containing protein [Hyphomonas sediminis]